MTVDLEARCRRLIADLGLGDAHDLRSVTPLTGGVASDIAVLDLGDRHLCAKFALPKLKVAEDWFAPVHRNRAEYEWLRFAGSVAPSAAPALYGWSEQENGFAMEFLQGDSVYLWKASLLNNAPDRGEAAAIGDTLGRIHAASTAPSFKADAFDNRDDFHALRLEPYLLFTATRHPDLARQLHALADALYTTTTVLVHGDVSPKNILIRDGAPVILDAECATMGDPCFDVAFCLNHLCLKAIHVDVSLLSQVAKFWSTYAPHVTWEPPAAIEARICALLPALMLARVDGKSPVEYLDPAQQRTIRQIARPLIIDPSTTLAALVATIEGSLP